MLNIRDTSAGKVLVVDDEPVIADTLSIILKQSGFDAMPAYGGGDAIEKARTWLPDLLLSDIIMPEINGVQAVDQILEYVPNCRVLLISGQAGVVAAVTESTLSTGTAVEIIAKPVHPDELIRRVRKLLNARGSSPPRPASRRE